MRVNISTSESTIEYDRKELLIEKRGLEKAIGYDSL
jgi:hypothetical protein